MDSTTNVRKKKKRKKKNYILRLLLLILIGVGLYFFTSSEIFDIEDVKVENNQHYTVEQVKEMAGVKIGQNIFEFKKKELKDKLLKDPYFGNVVIKRKLPSTIIIEVIERTEQATVKKGGKYLILDSNGLVLREADMQPAVTEIKGLNILRAEVGKALGVEQSAVFTDVLAMLKSMEGKELFFRRIDVASVTIKAYIYEQLLCEGTPENIKHSIDTGNLEAVVFEMYGKGIERGVIRIGSDNVCAFDPNVE